MIFGYEVIGGYYDLIFVCFNSVDPHVTDLATEYSVFFISIPVVLCFLSNLLDIDHRVLNRAFRTEEMSDIELVAYLTCIQRTKYEI